MRKTEGYINYHTPHIPTYATTEAPFNHGGTVLHIKAHKGKKRNVYRRTHRQRSTLLIAINSSTTATTTTAMALMTIKVKSIFLADMGAR